MPYFNKTICGEKTQLELHSQYNWENFIIMWRLFEMCFNCSDVERNNKGIRTLPLVWDFTGLSTLFSNTFPQCILFLAFVFIYCCMMNQKTVGNLKLHSCWRTQFQDVHHNGNNKITQQNFELAFTCMKWQEYSIPHWKSMQNNWQNW